MKGANEGLKKVILQMIFFNNEFVLEIIEKLKKDGIQILKSKFKGSSDAEITARYFELFEDIINDRSSFKETIEISGADYLLDVLKKDHEDLFKYIAYKKKNPIIWNKKTAKESLATITALETRSYIIQHLFYFTFLRYFPNEYEHFWCHQVGIMQKARRIVKAHLEVYNKAFDLNAENGS